MHTSNIISSHKLFPFLLSTIIITKKSTFVSSYNVHIFFVKRQILDFLQFLMKHNKTKF